MCKLCGGELRLLGLLGRMLHLVCENCGMQFNRWASREEIEEYQDSE